MRADAVKYLARTPERYDIVFLDPPYEMVESLRMPLAQHLPPALADGGLVVFETTRASSRLCRSIRSTSATVPQLTVYEAG